MKYLSTVLIASAFLLSASSASAQVASSTPAMGGHRHSVIAGSVDSIHHLGAWILENNASEQGKISYVSASPITAEEIRVSNLWSAIISFWSNSIAR